MKYAGYYNGEIGPLEEMKIPMLDRAVFFGDGCYDASTFKDHRIFALEDHFDRFYRSCRKLDIPFNLSREELECALLSCIEACDSDHGIIYWQCSRGTALRSHSYTNLHLTPNLLAFAAPFEMVPFKKRFRLLSREDKRYQICDIKTLNLILNVLAADECTQHGCDETVFFRTEGEEKRVTECAHSNVLILKDGVLISPPLDHLILPGITLKHLLTLAREHSIPTEQRTFTLEELKKADEVIITSSGGLCIAADELDGEPVGGRDPSRLKTLQNAYREYYDRYINN